VLPGESTIYLGDTARVPYGPKSEETVRRYALQAAEFLVGRGIQALVIACNTATAHAYTTLADALDIPVLGVVDPGAREAAETSPTGVIGVIGTRGTIESGTYDRAIRSFRADADVRSRACPLFVSLAEEGWVSGDVAELTARTYLEDLVEAGIDTLVLGCTHLKPLLGRVVGEGVRIVDSADATARATSWIVAPADPGSGPPTREYYVTDDPRRFEELAGRFLGASIEHLGHVEIDG
jgi:glutamate racemase